MNELQKRLLLLWGWATRYWTAWTTTTTSLASQWGLLINIDSATGDIAQTASGWIENEKFWFNAREFATSTSAEFDSAVTRTGRLTLKLSTLDATWRIRCFPAPQSNYSTAATNLTYSHYYIPCKGSTKYRYSIWIKTNNVAASSTFARFTQLNSSGTSVATTTTTLISGTTDWTRYSGDFTSTATSVFIWFEMSTDVAWNIWDAWFDVNSMTLEEVIEPVANSLVTPSPSLVSLTAVGSTDNIDTSLDPTFAAANTYTPPTAISETATNKQTFVPTKSKMTRIWVYPVAKGTGDWTVTIHDSSDVVQGTITIANASLTNGAVNYFNVPCNLTTGASYHFHVTSTVADWTVRVATSADLETVSYIQNYYKPTTNFKASQNNSTVSISADEDGFRDDWVINLSTWTYTYSDNYTNELKTIGSIYAVNTPYLFVDTANSRFFVNESMSTPTRPDRQPIFKFDMGGVASSMTIQATIRQAKIQYSYDNTTYYDGVVQDTASEVVSSFTLTPNQRIVYLKFVRWTATAWTFCYFKAFSITASINLSSLSTLRNYPTNKDIIKQYSTTLGAATTTATYRATKWGFPAIEYSATEYQYLDVDTTATGSTVAFSEFWTTYTTVADWASLAISSTSTPNLFVKVNITANRLYLSSNDYNASSDKDGSNKQTVTYQVIQ